MQHHNTTASKHATELSQHTIFIISAVKQVALQVFFGCDCENVMCFREQEVWDKLCQIFVLEEISVTIVIVSPGGHCWRLIR